MSRISLFKKKTRMHQGCLKLVSYNSMVDAEFKSRMWDEFSLNNDVFFRGPSCSEGNNGGGQKKLYLKISMNCFPNFPSLWITNIIIIFQCFAEICEVTEFLLPISIIISNAYRLQSLHRDRVSL